MALHQYIGARYVPRFMGLYDNTTAYEGLDVVDNGLGTSYIARKPVPVGTPLTDTEYWAVYGASSGAIINLQNQINALDATLTSLINTAQYEFFRNKRILIAGDSLSNEAVNPPNWVENFKTRLAALNVTIDNISFGGSSFADGSTPGSGMGSLLLTQDLTKYDILIIEEGTNDSTAQNNVGLWSSSNQAEFNGAINNLYAYITANNIALDVYWIMPGKRKLNPGLFPEPIPVNVFRSAIRKMCNFYNWKLIDWYSGLQNMNPENNDVISAIMPDGIHLTSNYAPYVANYIIEKVISGGETGINDMYDKISYNTFASTYVSGTLTVDVNTNGEVTLNYLLNIASGASGGLELIDFPDIMYPSYKLPRIISGNNIIYDVYEITDKLYIAPTAAVSSNDTIALQQCYKMDKIIPCGNGNI